MANWIVTGADIETGEHHSIVIEGISRAHAEVLALKRGMRVHSIEPDQLCPGDDARLSAINFVDPTEPLSGRIGPVEGIEFEDPPLTLPAWITVRRCRQARVAGTLMLLGGLAAYLAHMPHEGYALAAAVGGLLVVGAWAARRFNLIRIVPVATLP